MFELITNFPQQLREAIKIGESASLTKAKVPISNIVISGLGGSGIGGSIASQLFEKESPVPITVNNKYFLPAFVNSNTLVIISSYSGNTEETISCMKEAMKKSAKIVCITSGGAIAEMAINNKLDFIKIPGGNPPRTCLGYSLTQLMYILSFYGIISPSFKEKLNAAIELIIDQKPQIIVESKAVAAKLLHKLPVIYSVSSGEAISIRFRQQLNENAKVLCWHHVFPELNHNELVGWTEKNENMAVVIFRNNTDFIRNQNRIEISKQIIARYTSTIIEIFSKGESNIEHAIYLIHLGDWISYFLADLKGIDAVEVKVIDLLKSELLKS
ncbi:MAG: bifunctional phosphoglucose/phosphomannose isomerase [Bacteroidetes bacterium]|nr:bifunctional phosphoglucose/phosphomannose isomerase [Bacteroidota bacterium]HET6244443.1 bifunctional phosphoglucose/phosphomannose isomerase [Bacteroidia bacterium]